MIRSTASSNAQIQTGRYKSQVSFFSDHLDKWRLFNNEDPVLYNSQIAVKTKPLITDIYPQRQVELSPEVDQLAFQEQYVRGKGKPAVAWVDRTREVPSHINWEDNPSDWGLVFGEANFFTVEVTLTREAGSEWMFPDSGNAISIAITLDGVVEAVQSIANDYIKGPFAVACRATFWGKIKSNLKASRWGIRIYIPPFANDGYMRLVVDIGWTLMDPDFFFSYVPLLSSEQQPDSDLESDSD